MPRGGARVGAGRKPKPRQFQALDGGRVVDSGVSAIPPEDLPADQREFWHNYAQRAIDQGTLTIDTVAAFRLLCEADAEKTAIKQTIDKDGRTFIKVTVDGSGQEHQELKAHPLTGHYRQTARQVENLMGRFKLAPFGKAETRRKAPATAAVNPWAAVVKR